MAERMVEYVGWKDPIGDGLYNMGVTDERIIRCRDCKNHCKEMSAFNQCDVNGGYWDDDGFCSRAEPRKEQA